MHQSNKTYLFIHVIWCTGNRDPVLKKPVRHVLFAYLQGLMEEKLVKVLGINGVDDHVHCLFQLHPVQSLSQVMKVLKEGSAQWVNENRILETVFTWEEGYAAYSVSPSNIRQVMDYIFKQEEHHKTKTLQSELDIFEKSPF